MDPMRKSSAANEISRATPRQKYSTGDLPSNSNLWSKASVDKPLQNECLPESGTPRARSKSLTSTTLNTNPSKSDGKKGNTDSPRLEFSSLFGFSRDKVTTPQGNRRQLSREWSHADSTSVSSANYSGLEEELPSPDETVAFLTSHDERETIL